MRRVSYLKAVGIALGFISGTQNPGLASPYTHPGMGGRDETLRDDDYLVRSTDPHGRSFFSENRSHETSIETAIATSLLESTQHRFYRDEVQPDGGRLLSEGIRFDAGEGSTHVSATPLPAALPLFVGGMGLLGFLGRRRKNKASSPPPR